jgi:hypothetical protein
LAKSKGGRPSLYQPEYADLARKFCMLGATNDQLAVLLGVRSPSTIDEWIAKKSEFAEAVKAGRAVADANVADSLYHRALGYEHDSEEIHVIDKEVVRVPVKKKYPPDATSMIFWLKNRRPDLWRDKIEHQHTADDELLKAFDAACERAKKR